MKKRAFITALFVLAFVTFSFAKDITGNWKGMINDQFEINYTFKVDGEKLTGSSKGPDGTDAPFSNGVIKGDDLSFTIDIMGNSTKVTGKVNGDVITLTFKVQDNDIKVDLKKV